MQKPLEVIAGLGTGGLLLPSVEIIHQVCGRSRANEKKPDVNWAITCGKLEACQALADVLGRRGLAAGITRDGSSYRRHWTWKYRRTVGDLWQCAVTLASLKNGRPTLRSGTP